MTVKELITELIQEVAEGNGDSPVGVKIEKKDRNTYFECDTISLYESGGGHVVIQAKESRDW